MNPREIEETSELIELIQGRLSPVAAIRLRWKIATDPQIAAEWQALKQIERDLHSICSERSKLTTPTWPQSKAKARPTVTFGGLTVNRHVFLLAYASLFAAVTCTYLLYHSGGNNKQTGVATLKTDQATEVIGTLFAGDAGLNRFINAESGGSFAVGGQNWQVKQNVMGEVRIYDSDRRLIHTSVNGGENPTGERMLVQVDGILFRIRSLRKQTELFRLVMPDRKTVGFIEIKRQSDPAKPRIYDNFDDAMIVAAREKKPMFVEFTGYTCVNARSVEVNILSRADMQQDLTKYIRVRLYTDGGTHASANLRLLQQKFLTSAIPLYAIMDSNGKVIRYTQQQQAKAIERLLTGDVGQP